MLSTLPFDVLLPIFSLLSVYDLCRLAQTCKCLHDWIDEHSVWVDRYSHQRSMFHPSKQPSLSTKEMRKSVVREAIVDTEWQKPDGNTRVVTKLYPRNYSAVVGRSSVLPGGDFVLFVLADGGIDLRAVVTDTPLDKKKGPLWPSITCTTAGPGISMFLTSSRLVPISFQEGYIIIVTKHTVTLDDHGSHIRCYRYRLAMNPEVMLLADFTIPTSIRIYDWSTFDNILYCIHVDFLENLYFSQLSEDFLVPITNASISDAWLMSIKLAKPSDLYEQYKLVMLSPDRMLVVGTDTITVYDLPHTQDTHEPPINPIWNWPSKEHTGPTLHLHCDALSYSSFSKKPIIWIFASYKVLHCLELSATGDPVGQHFEFPMDYGGPASDSSRAVWMFTRENVADFSTIRLQNPPTEGRFEVRFEEGKLESGYSFDETSGRVALRVVEEPSGERCVYVASIARLEMFKKGY